MTEKKKKSFREIDNDKIKGKRKYRERLAEEAEAEKEIDSFVKDSNRRIDWREPINEEQEHNLINDRQ